MLVTVMVGNSTVRWIGWNGEAVAARGEVRADAIGADGDLPADFTQAMGETRTVMASVNPVIAERVRVACASAGGTLSVFGDTLPNPLPLSPAMTDPDGIGTDRLVAAYAAWRLEGGPVVVVDVGTAITVNAVSATGQFAGGAIAVGPHLAAQALERGTAQLPLGPGDATDRALGRDTAEALAAGVSVGLGGLVRALVTRAREELGVPAVCFATGGGLDRLSGLADLIDRAEPDLALIGLRLAAVAK